jgi:hypothetical protein
MTLCRLIDRCPVVAILIVKYFGKLPLGRKGMNSRLLLSVRNFVSVFPHQFGQILGRNFAYCRSFCSAGVGQNNGNTADTVHISVSQGIMGPSSVPYFVTSTMTATNSRVLACCMNVKLHSEPRTSEQSFLSVSIFYSLSTDYIWMWIS